MKDVEGALVFKFTELDAAVELFQRKGGYFYFHDDGDSFNPRLCEIFQDFSPSADAIVTPLLRLGIPAFTGKSRFSEIVWGAQRYIRYRYQTNNYAIHSRHCRSLSAIKELKDHILASHHAAGHDFTDKFISTVVSATVKTPASASMLSSFLANRNSVDTTLASWPRCDSALPQSPEYSWMSEPLRKISELIDGIRCGRTANV